jgi:hypothetical protein
MLYKRLSAVSAVVIINIFALANCAVENEEGKLIFAHVVSCDICFWNQVTWTLNYFFLIRYSDTGIALPSSHTPQIPGKTQNIGQLVSGNSQM